MAAGPAASVAPGALCGWRGITGARVLGGEGGVGMEASRVYGVPRDVQTRVIAVDERMGIVWLRMAWGVRERGGDQLTVWETFKVYDNQIFGNWISIFYGYPTFAWIPTHNLNHHKYVNRAGDATITWRYTNRHNLLVALT